MNLAYILPKHLESVSSLSSLIAELGTFQYMSSSAALQLFWKGSWYLICFLCQESGEEFWWRSGEEKA